MKVNNYTSVLLVNKNEAKNTQFINECTFTDYFMQLNNPTDVLCQGQDKVVKGHNLLLVTLTCMNLLV